MELEPDTKPTEAGHSIHWGALIFWPSVIIILYVSSIGPALLMYDKGYFRSPTSEKFLCVFYQPLEWAHTATIFEKPLNIYTDWWEAKSRKRDI